LDAACHTVSTTSLPVQSTMMLTLTGPLVVSPNHRTVTLARRSNTPLSPRASPIAFQFSKLIALIFPCIRKCRDRNTPIVATKPQMAAVVPFPGSHSAQKRTAEALAPVFRSCPRRAPAWCPLRAASLDPDLGGKTTVMYGM
jgi:hypothetical protein